MRKYLVSILGIIFTVVVIFGLKTYISSNQEKVTHASASALYGTNTSLTIPAEEGDKGTITNPFVILEIVPYEGYAEIGYMIKGSEPIPLDQLSFDRNGGEKVATTGGMECKWKAEYTFDIPEGDIVGTAAENWKEVAGKVEQYGYYEKVEEEKGSFYQVKEEVDTVATITYAVATDENKGNYNWMPYVDNKATDLTDTMSVSEEFGADKVHTSWERTQYQRERNFFTYENKFLTEVLKVPADKINDYKIMVVTITPKNLNLSINKPWIDRADLISFSPKSHYDNDFVSLWEEYHGDMAIENPATRPTSFGFNGSGKTTCNDLTWEATVEILRKASVDEDKAPIIFDVRVFTEDTSFSWNNGSNPNYVTPYKYYSDGDTVNKNIPSSNPNYLNIASQGYFNNIAKLYLIMQQMEPTKFYHEFIETGLIKSVIVVTNNDGTETLKNGTVTITTGYYTDLGNSATTKYNVKHTSADDSAAVWSIYTFLPYNFFENRDVVASNEIWKTIGIDNYNVINKSSPQISVRHNFYSINGDQSLTQGLISNTVPYDNVYTKDAFDYYKKTSGTTISPAEAIYYLLHKEIPVYNQETLHILEIEPCKDFIWDGTTEEWSVSSSTNGSNYARQYFSKYFPHFTGKVSITTMTSAEYIGNIDDINAVYDLVLFGLRDGMLKKDSNNVTNYNDSTLNGKVYIHNGDTILQSNSKLRGLQKANSPVDTYRFSGNDITQLKLEELKSYMEAGNPVVLDTGFYTNSSRSNININKIASNTNIYRLANLTSNTQLFYADGISINNLENSLSVSNCRIVFGKNDEVLVAENCYPVVYHDRSKDKYKRYTDAQIYINGGDNKQYRTLQYKFYIQDDNTQDTNYTVKLYLDINADGKFDNLTENISSLTLVTEYGYAEDYDSLDSGVNYTLTRTLEEDYSGVLPWKLEIIANSVAGEETKARDSIINYSALQPIQKVKLNILQILSNTNNNLKLTNAPFNTLIPKVNDFEIKITTWTVDQLNVLCKNNSSPYTYLLSDDNDNFGVDTGSNTIDNDNDGKYDFDMLILGFADMYSDIGYNNTLQNIEDFIEEGKTVLFTHDTTSFINEPKSSYDYDDFWGYSLNQKFRNILGMDRFGVTLDDSSKRKEEGKDYTTTLNDYTGYIHGYSNLILNRYAKEKLRIRSGSSQYDINQFGNHKNIDIGDIEKHFTTNKVTNVNHGQITMYPFEIADKFDVATTHAQYYQLDMEDDDVVVWYCLSDGTSNGNGVYSTTPNDVRNNYYIYNLGNITYSGVGHSAISNGTVNNVEAELFVNTMVAAYTATAKESEVQITNKNTSIDAMGNQYIYVDYDIYDTSLAYGSEVNKIDTEQYQRVKFRVIDNNILFNKTITVSYFLVGDTSETEITGILTKKVKNNVEVTKVIGGKFITKVNSGEEYYIDIPLSKLQGKNMTKEYNLATQVSIHVNVTYGKLSDKSKSSKQSFTLARRGLFDLD